MLEEIFIPCVQTCLNHAEDMFTLRLHHVYRHVYIMLEDMFTCYLMNRFDIRRHIYSMWDDMFTPSLNTCLHHVGKPVYTLYEICLPNIVRHICTGLKEILTQCWKTWFYHVWLCIYTMFEDNFQSYLKTCLHTFWRLFFCIMFEGMLCYVWRPVDIKFQACLKTYSYNVGRHSYTKLMTFVTHFWSHFHYTVQNGVNCWK